MPATAHARQARPVGVFDSGVGGLTVLSALAAALPAEDFLYLGDTARLPYGTKSEDTVVRYALQAADALVERDIKCLVIACNTASAAALGAMQRRYGELPVIGVIEPGAQAACESSRSGRIAVIATEATARGGAYARAIKRRQPTAQVITVACQLFVSLAEEGWTAGPIAAAVAMRYLQPVLAGAPDCDTLVLGCTHFPLLGAVIRAAIGEQIQLVDSAATTAEATRDLLSRAELLRRTADAAAGGGTLRFLATDGCERFASVGSRFLGRDIEAAQVELIDL